MRKNLEKETENNSQVKVDRRGVWVYPMLDPKDAIRDQLRTQSADKYPTIDEILEEMKQAELRRNSATNRALAVSQDIVSTGTPSLRDY